MLVFLVMLYVNLFFADNTHVLGMCFRNQWKDGFKSAEFLPFEGTDFSHCTLIKPPVTGNHSFDNYTWSEKMMEGSERLDQYVLPLPLGMDDGLIMYMDAEVCRKKFTLLFDIQGHVIGSKNFLKVYDYGLHPHGKKGFRFAIHGRRDIAVMQIGDIDVAAGTVTQILLSASKSTTTQEAIQRYQPEHRGCYTDEEFEFKRMALTRYTYSLTNCYFAGVMDKIVRDCGCIPWFLDSDNATLCKGNGHRCAKNLLEHVGSIREAEDVNNVQRRCLQGCEFEAFRVSRMDLPMYSWRSFPSQLRLLCSLMKKLSYLCFESENKTQREKLVSSYPKLCQNLKEYRDKSSPYYHDCEALDGEELSRGCQTRTIDAYRRQFKRQLHYNLKSMSGNEEKDCSEPKNQFPLLCSLYAYAKDNVAVVNVFFRSKINQKLIRDQKSPVIWFVSTMGGILGLVCGVSMVTCVELSQALIESFFLVLLQLKKCWDLRHRDVVNDLQLYRYTVAKKLSHL